MITIQAVSRVIQTPSGHLLDTLWQIPDNPKSINIRWGYNVILFYINPIRVILISWFLCSQVRRNVWRLSGKCLRDNYTGVETARLWNWFFLPFLAETKQELLFLSQVYCKICPYSFQFALLWARLLCFSSKIGSSRSSPTRSWPLTADFTRKTQQFMPK